MFVVHHDRRQCLLAEKVPSETQLPFARSQKFYLPIESEICDNCGVIFCRSSASPMGILLSGLRWRTSWQDVTANSYIMNDIFK